MSPDAVILSPHFDDAVLSCWHVLANADEVLVVNVFAGEPSVGTLGWWDRLAGATDSAAAVRMRIEEDRQALALAGCTAVNLPFLDGQYRQSDEAPGEIVEALREVVLADARLYAPAGLGDHHPDHAAVRAAALALHAEGADLRLYADLPHATVLGWPRWVLHGGSSTGADPAGEQWASQLESTDIPVERMVAATHRLPAAAHARKLEAVRVYRSQTAPLQRVFGSSLEDPQLLGFEVDWRLPLLA
jgi:LmbE family N-acetylglucosaminyl deacetylase